MIMFVENTGKGLKRTQLKRSTKPLKRTPLKRKTPLKYGGVYTKRRYSTKAKYTRVLIKELDRLIQKKYVQLNPRCITCGGSTSEMHHYIQKSQSMFLRWAERNLVPLCRACHCKHHISGDPRIHQMILLIKGHEWADELEIDRRRIFKPTVENLEEILKSESEVK